ncbi:peptidoglycan-binding protein [Spirillospora sp. CA-253888]
MTTEVRDAPPQQRERRRRGHRRRNAAVVAVVVAIGAAAAATLGLGGGSGGGEAAAELPPRTTPVTRQTLKDTETADGTLGFGESVAAVGRKAGTLTWMPESGAQITRGERLYEVDTRPVTLMYGSKPAYRALKPGVEGNDVERFERNLAALGYDGFTVDDEYTEDTADAVEEWQEDVHLEETGEVALGDVVFAPGPVRVDGREVGKGDPVSPGRKVLTYTGTEKAVTVELDTADQRMAKKGAAVEVELPDGGTVKGVIDEVSTVVEPGGQGEDPTTKVEVTVALRDRRAQKAADAYALASVDVTFTAGTRKDVLTVPVAALVALAEGGFGVEAVKNGASTYVPVRTGLFASGRVEVSGAGVTEGMAVGIPK